MPTQPEWQRTEPRTGSSRRWGSLRGGAGVGIVAGSAALGAAATIAMRAQPGRVLGACIVIGTVIAALAVRPRSGRLIFPVPILSYLIAALIAGIAYNRSSSKTELVIGGAQWVASGFFAMTLATVLAIVLITARWLLRRRYGRVSAGPDGPGSAAGPSRRPQPGRPSEVRGDGQSPPRAARGEPGNGQSPPRGARGERGDGQSPRDRGGSGGGRPPRDNTDQRPARRYGQYPGQRNGPYPDPGNGQYAGQPPVPRNGQYPDQSAGPRHGLDPDRPAGQPYGRYPDRRDERYPDGRNGQPPGPRHGPYPGQPAGQQYGQYPDRRNGRSSDRSRGPYPDQDYRP